MSLVVTIKKMVYGAHGLSKLPDGLTVFVPGAIPGEEVEIEVTEKRKDYAFATILDIVSPSSHRIEPQCPYYPDCGGCQLQHVDYMAQLSLKREMLQDALCRNTGIKPSFIKALTPSPREVGYRHRLRFNVDPFTGRLGFLKRATHLLVPVKKCLLALDEINFLLSALPENLAWKRICQHVDSVIIGVSLLEGLATLFIKASDTIGTKDLQAILHEVPGIKSIFVRLPGGIIKGPYPADAPHNGRRLFPFPSKASGNAPSRILQVSPGVFVQNNWEINEKLVNQVISLAGLDSSRRLLDLHCGMGNFLLPLGESAKEAIGVDADKRAIENGKLNAKNLGIPATFFTRTDLEAAIGLVEQADTFHTVLLDPPRGGCREILPLMPDLVTERLIYISCDPPTLSRDIRILQSMSLELQELHSFDMFPQTFHMEVVALFRTRGKA